MRTNTILRFASIALGLTVAAALAALPVIADDGDDGKFDFDVNPLVFELLFTDLDTNSSKFSEYRDMDSDALVRRFRLVGESRDGNRLFDLGVRNAGRADAHYSLRYRNSGRYSVLLDYNVIPHRFGNDGRILHSTAGGPGLFTISDTTQQTLQDNLDAAVVSMIPIDYDFLEAQLQPFIDSATVVNPQLERRRARALVEVGKLSTMSWTLDVKQETREGSRPYGATFGFNNAIELPEPIKYDTTSAEIVGEWKGQRGGARFGINFSRFDNEVETLVYDNPWRVVDATGSRGYIAPSSSALDSSSRGRNALAPDNRFGMAYVSGHGRFGDSGWYNGQISYGQMRQDDPLLPHTINSAIIPGAANSPPFDASDPANLPASHADTKVNITHLTANVGTKIGEKGSVKFRARHYDYDNQSVRLSFPGYVRMDSVWEPFGRITVPFSYTKQKLGVEFGYDPSRKTHLAFGYDRADWDRDFREVEESEEDIFHFTVDSRASKRVSVRGGWEFGDRSTSPYMTSAIGFSFLDPADAADNLFELRKYDEAEREYNQGNISTSILASDAINVTLGVTLRDDEYGDANTYGLVSDEILQYGAEVDYTPSEKFSLFLFAQLADRESFQKARNSGGSISTDPLDDWNLLLQEDTITLGLGLNGRLSDRTRLDLNGSLSDSDGDSIFSAPPGGSESPVSFDEYDDNEWLVMQARLGFEAGRNVDLGLHLIREEFTTNRFQRSGLTPYLPGTLILNANDGDYEANILAVDMTIVF